MLDAGRAARSVEGVRGGRLPLPTDYVFKHLPGAARGSGGAGESGGDDAKRSQAIAVLLWQQPFDPVLPIDGSRRARIIGLEVDDEGLGLVVQADTTGARRWAGGGKAGRAGDHPGVTRGPASPNMPGASKEDTPWINTPNGSLSGSPEPAARFMRNG